MNTNDRHPGLIKFRAAKARRKALYEVKETVRVSNPTYSDNKINAIAMASLAAKDRK